MSLYNIPNICKDASLIAGNPIIAAVISSYFNEDSEYFTILEPPRMERLDYTNEIIRRNNIISYLKPKYIILASLEDKALEKFLEKFHHSQTVIIKTLEDVEKVEEKRKFATIGTIYCNQNELSHALLLAKTLKMKLEVNESSPTLQDEFEKYLPKSKHHIIIDDLEGFAPVIAANYAYAVGAEIRFLPKSSINEVEEVYDELLNRNIPGDTARSDYSERRLQERQVKYRKLIPTKEIDFITFITIGIPIGYYLQDVPSTHLYSYPELGLNIFAGIYYSLFIRETRTAVIVDPDEFKDSEIEFVSKTLDENNIYTFKLNGKDASVVNVRNFIEYFPYDLLFICSHSGEIEGHRVQVRFTDRWGKNHIITVDHAKGWGLTGEGEGEERKVQIVHYISFIELDDIDWISDEIKKITSVDEIIEDFSKIGFANWDVIGKVKIPYVKDCFAIKVSDGYCLMGFHAAGAEEFPIIINNSCHSFYKFSNALIFGGARAYVGTLSPVINVLAKEIAEEIFRNLRPQIPLPVVIWEAQRKIISKREHRTYVHFGCHFTNIIGSDKDMTDDVKNIISINISRLQEKLEEVRGNKELTTNTKNIIKFLSQIEVSTKS